MDLRTRLMIVGVNLAWRVVFVALVVVTSLIPGVSVLGALLLVSAATFALNSIRILTARPPDPGAVVLGRGGGPRRPPPGSAGDRHPRRPAPTAPAGVVHRPLDES